MRNLLALLLLAPCALLAQVPDYVPTDGLVAWYPFNGNANDDSGISADGQVFSATLTEDRFGNAASAYYFSGSGCTPHIETNIDFQGSDEGMSISFWLNRTGNGCIYPRLFGFWNGSNSPQSWGMAWGNSAVLDYMGMAPPNNQWHHVAVSVTSDSIHAYLNGELMGSVASGKQPPLASFMSIGRMTHPAYDAFNGSMDDFAVYNRAITPEEVSQLFGASIAPALPSYIPTDGLIAYYPLDGDGQDIGPLGLDGTTLGTECGADRFTDSCGAVTFTDGDRIQVEPDPDFTSQKLTSSFWVRLDSYDGYNHFLNRWSESLHEFVFSANSTGLYLYVENEYFQSDVLPPLHEWHHVTFWYDAVAGTAGIYMDGDSVANFIGVDPVNPSGLPLCIGGTTNPGAYNSVNGEMDDLAIWNRVLTAEEIEAVYEAGLPSPTTSAGLFDGDDHIWLTDADFLNFGQSSFTAHVQFRPTDLSDLVECCGYQTLIAKGAAGGTGEKGFNLDLRGEPGDARIKCNLSTGPGINVILNAPIEEGQWYDLVFISDWDTEWASLFVNGTLVDEGSMAGLGDMNNSWNPSIGRFVWNNSNSYNGAFFKGEMSWLRILNEADYELGQSPCALREFTVLELTDFTAEEVADQVSSSFNIDEVIDVNAPCGGFAATYGCTDPTACNYNPTATEDDGSCNFQIPVFLGNDTALCGTELVLDAGSGYADYQWSTGDTTRTIVVDVSGEYGVSVSGGLNQSLTITSSQETHPFSAPPIDGAWTEGTISTWVNFQSRDLSLDADGTHIFSGYTGPTDIVMLGFHTSALDGNNGELLFGFYESGPGWRFATSSLIPELDVWYYITASWGGNGLTIYVDGELSGHHPYSGPIPVPDQYTLGGNLNASAPCKMANLSIWDQQLELEEISALSNCSSFAEDNLVGVWNFEGQLSNAYLDLISGISSIVPSSVTAVIIDPGISDCTAELSPTNDLSSINQCPATDTLIVEFLIAGCTDSTACNFDIDLSCDDGSCEYGCLFCGDGTTWNDSLQMCIGDCPVEETPSLPNCGEGTVWDPVAEECIVAIPADINFDGCVTVGDLLELLAVHGTCPPYPEWPDFPGDTSTTGWSCGDPLPYQGHDYATVQIGDQCWFAENSRFLPSVSPPEMGSESDGEPHAYVYDYSGTDVYLAMQSPQYLLHGALYNFQATTSWDVCPSGWHVPTKDEFRELDIFLGLDPNSGVGWSGMDSGIGNDLKSQTGWCCNDQGNNATGFSAIGSGGRWDDDAIGFHDLNNACRWWTQTPSGDLAWHHDVAAGYPGIYWKNDAPKARGHSIRCLKD